MLLNKLLEKHFIYYPRYNKKYDSFILPYGEHVFTTTTKILQAKQLFEAQANVLYEHHKCIITPHFAGVGFIASFESEEAWMRDVKMISNAKGVCLYEFNELLAPDNNFDHHLKKCMQLGVKPLFSIVIEETKFIVARITYKTLLANMKFEKFYSVFTQEPLEVDSIDFMDFFVQNINKKTMTRGKKPNRYFESTLPDFKQSRLFDLAKKDLFQLKREESVDKFIKYPNPEQIAILLASGKLSGEVKLQDGRRMIFKGTDRVVSITKDILTSDGEIEAQREIEVREAVVIGFDLDKKEFISFE